jgi:hypothetical protein
MRKGVNARHVGDVEGGDGSIQPRDKGYYERRNTIRVLMGPSDGQHDDFATKSKYSLVAQAFAGRTPEQTARSPVAGTYPFQTSLHPQNQKQTLTTLSLVYFLTTIIIYHLSNY